MIPRQTASVEHGPGKASSSRLQSLARPLALLALTGLVTTALALVYVSPLSFGLSSLRMAYPQVQLLNKLSNGTDAIAWELVSTYKQSMTMGLPSETAAQMSDTTVFNLLGAPSSSCWRNAEQLDKAFPAGTASQQGRRSWGQISAQDFCTLPDMHRPINGSLLDPDKLIKYAQATMQCDASKQPSCSAAQLHVFRHVIHVAAHGTARYYVPPGPICQPQLENSIAMNPAFCNPGTSSDGINTPQTWSPFLREACQLLPDMLHLMGSIAAHGEAVDARWDPTLPDVPGKYNHPIPSTHSLQQTDTKSVLTNAIARAAVPSVAAAAQMVARSSPNYMVGFALHNNERIMPHFIIHMLALVTYLPPGHVLVSCYESGSTDSTPQWLRLLQGLLDLLHIPNYIQIQGNVTRAQIPQRIPFLAEVRNQVLLPLQDPAAYAAALSRVHHPLGAIAQQHGLVYPAHKLIFLNDPFFSWQDVIRMIHHDADMVCGLDLDFWDSPGQGRRSMLIRPTEIVNAHQSFPQQQTGSMMRHGRLEAEVEAGIQRQLRGQAEQQAGALNIMTEVAADWEQQADIGFWPHTGSPQRALLWGETGWFYDIWVARDISGRRFDNLMPLVFESETQKLAKEGLPFPVQCCWNAGVVVNATVYLSPSGLKSQQAAIDRLSDSYRAWLHILDTSAPLPAGKPVGLKFRPPRPGKCLASECTTMCNDLWGLNYGRILVDPSIRLTYKPYGRQFLHEETLNRLPLLNWRQLQSKMMAKNISLWQMAKRPEKVLCCPEPSNGGGINWSACFMEDNWLSSSSAAA